MKDDVTVILINDRGQVLIERKPKPENKFQENDNHYHFVTDINNVYIYKQVQEEIGSYKKPWRK